MCSARQPQYKRHLDQHRVAESKSIAERTRWNTQVLAHVFMARCDTAYSVRTAAVHVWKTVVVNTPRTTTEILPVLMNHLIEALGSPGATGCIASDVTSLTTLRMSDTFIAYTLCACRIDSSL